MSQPLVLDLPKSDPLYGLDLRAVPLIWRAKSLFLKWSSVMEWKFENRAFVVEPVGEINVVHNKLIY